jgi:hypothetical protein
VNAKFVLDWIDQPVTIPAVALIFANEASHHCTIEIKTKGPVYGMTGEHIIASPYCQYFKIHLDVDFPDWDSDVGSFYEGTVETSELTGNADMRATDLSVSGRVRVKRLEQWGVWAQPTVHTPQWVGTTFRDLELIADTLVTPEYGWRAFDVDGIVWERVRCNIGDFSFTRPGGFEFRESYFPNSVIGVTSSVSGYDRWVDGCTFEDRVLDTELDRTGQINTQKDGIPRLIGGLQAYGPLYYSRSGTGVMADGETVTLQTAAELGNSSFFIFTAASDSGNCSGMAIAMVGPTGTVTVVAVSETGLTWGSAGGTAVTITNPVGAPTSINARWNVIQL